MKKDIKKEIVEKIKKDKTKPRSKLFFKAIKYFGIASLIILGFFAVYLFNLSLYLPRRGLGPNSPIFRPMMFATIPWALVLLGLAVIGLMIFIYVKYEGGYKKNLLWTIIITTIVTVTLGVVVSASRINERMNERPHFRRMYDWGEGNFVPGRKNRLFQKSNQEQLPFLPLNQRKLKDFN